MLFKGALLLGLGLVVVPLSAVSAQSMEDIARTDAVSGRQQFVQQHLLPHQDAEMPYSAKADFPELSVIKAILSEPEGSIDLAKVEIAVERMIDPSINPFDTLHHLDMLAKATRARFPQGDKTDTEEKGLILYSTMRDPGVWNEYRSFSYDLNDPLGKDINSKLLSKFLATRKGNCVSMPVLYVVLGQKLGLPVTLSSAPHHEFAKFRKDDGTWTNLEVTSYGGQTDQHYVERMNISQAAMTNQVWLRTLTERQSAIEIMHTLVDYYSHSSQPEKGLVLTDLFIREDPKDIVSVVSRGNFFCQLSDQRYRKYGGLKKIPVSMRSDYEALENNCALDHAKAEELGWVEETPQQKAKYLEFIKRAKDNQGG